MKKLFAVIVGGILIFSSNASAQNLKTGKFGLGIDGVETTTRFAAKYYLTDQFAMEAIGWFDMSSPNSETPEGLQKYDGVNYVIGVDALYHFDMENFAPYLGVEALFNSNKPSGFYAAEPSVRNDLQVGVVLGVEYFISNSFSIGVKEKIDTEFRLSDKSAYQNSSRHFSTKGEITGRFYF